MKDEQFKGKTAVITGAASGIGAGLAAEAAERGMNLVLADIDIDKLKKSAAELPAPAIAVFTQVTDYDSVEQLSRIAYSEMGAVDLLFNNAGVQGPLGYTWEMDPDAVANCISVNVLGVFNGIRAFVPKMLRSGMASHIVNTASLGAFQGCPLMSPYIASKFAVRGLTESLHYEMELIKAPIKVSLLSPGAVKTSILSATSISHGTTDDKSAGFLNSLKISQADGLSPGDFAKRVFDSVARGDYWIFPQADQINDLVRIQADSIVLRRPPPSPEI